MDKVSDSYARDSGSKTSEADMFQFCWIMCFMHETTGSACESFYDPGQVT